MNTRCLIKSLPMLIVLGLLLFSQSAMTQTRETRRLIQEIKKNIREQSVVRNQVDWNLLEKRLKELPFDRDHATDKEMVYATFKQALMEAGDRHSLFYSREVAGGIQREGSSAVYATSLYLGDRVGYLSIPSCLTFDYQRDQLFADTIISQIRALDHQGVHLWIIDLRGNRGGNVWPMLAGLTPIIGEGLIAHTVTGQQITPLSIQRGRINYSQIRTQVYQTSEPYKKIAVLIDNYTASSGEMLAISLLGLDRVRSFGSPSSGLTTSNRSLYLKDGSILFLSTGYMADRKRKIYKDGIVPLEVLSQGLNEVEKISLVKEWLLAN